MSCFIAASYQSLFSRTILVVSQQNLPDPNFKAL